ncbi:FG-GAP repeat domain-containing protein [Paludisphaera mucosa]|uniref:VCBS repeat-containing protein n=1 Tax=Paludisphaera mucosa TaxID=3030827 RepID=A0ABT6FGQ8_9BACT|nr:VCBS repeat-containing protein [Paludisphaera mucosa]MDG3006768.1 VCBS repeat-containing protein [Paludisphaera mucosa]
MRILSLSATLALATFASGARGADFPRFETQEIDPHVGEVCYAVTVADVDGDGKPDVVAASEDAVVWYQNPSWTKHDVIRGRTKRDNVCVQAHDVDGDGRIDLTLGAGWKPSDTGHAGTLQWLGRDGGGDWKVHPIECDEPTIHRIRWGDVKGTGKDQLIVLPLQGRGTKGPNWGAGAGVNVVVYDVPGDPAYPHWRSEVADHTLHTIHNAQVVDLLGDGRKQIVLAAWEGVFALDRRGRGGWSRTKIGEGDQAGDPFKGASEVKVGRLTDGSRYVATIEPWHGNQVVVYTPPKAPKEGESLWTRKVLAKPVAWGHAVWCADVDGDGDDDLIIGQRDPNAEKAEAPRGPGVFVFAPRPGDDGPTFDRHDVDDGGMACEDALAADLDGDGRMDLVAGGRATHNVRIYWNRAR